MGENEYLVFKRIVVDAAHYIPGHPTCGSPHGHSYIIENLSVHTLDGKPFELNEQGISVDFGDIKSIIKRYMDHVNIIPNEHWEQWRDFYKMMDFDVNRLTPVKHTSCEFLARELKKKLQNKIGYRVHFRLFEGADDTTGGFQV